MTMMESPRQQMVVLQNWSSGKNVGEEEKFWTAEKLKRVPCKSSSEDIVLPKKLSVAKPTGPPKKLRPVRQKVVVVEKQGLHHGKKLTARQVQVEANKANKRKVVPQIDDQPSPSVIAKREALEASKKRYEKTLAKERPEEAGSTVSLSSQDVFGSTSKVTPLLRNQVSFNFV